MVLLERTEEGRCRPMSRSVCGRFLGESGGESEGHTQDHLPLARSLTGQRVIDRAEPGIRISAGAMHLRGLSVGPGGIGGELNSSFLTEVLKIFPPAALALAKSFVVLYELDGADVFHHGET